MATLYVSLIAIGFVYTIGVISILFGWEED